MSKIIVIGSSNTDLAIKTIRIPEPGETVMGGTFMMTAGGKGANQAVAVARLGGDVAFVTKVGDDMFGDESRARYVKEGLPEKFLLVEKGTPSGVALITVDAKGENCIVVRVRDDALCEHPRGKQRWGEKNFGCWYTPTTGIYKTVWLEYVPERYIRRLKITPSLTDDYAAEFTLTLDAPCPQAMAQIAVSFRGKPVKEFSVCFRT